MKFKYETREDYEKAIAEMLPRSIKEPDEYEELLDEYVSFCDDERDRRARRRVRG